MPAKDYMYVERGSTVLAYHFSAYRLDPKNVTVWPQWVKDLIGDKGGLQFDEDGSLIALEVHAGSGTFKRRWEVEDGDYLIRDYEGHLELQAGVSFKDRYARIGK